MRKIFCGSRVVSAALLILALGGLSGCDRLNSYSEQELIQRAKDFQLKGDIKASVIELKNALQKDPNNAEARWLLGEIYIQTGQGSEAEKEFQKARQLGIAEESIKPFMGQALLLQGLYKRVLDEITISSATSPKNAAKIKEMRGRAEFGLEHFQEACILFRQSLETDAGYVPAYRGLARCSVMKQDLEGAKAQLDAAIRLDDKDAETWVLLGDFERGRNNRQAAETAYLKAKKIDAKNIGAYLGMTLNYIYQGKLDQAAQEIQRARKDWPNSVVVQYVQAFVSFKQKKFTQARDQIQQVLKAAPDYMPSVFLSGEIAFALGAHEKAESDLNRFLAKYPDSIEARKVLVATLLKTGRPAQALKTLKPFLEGATTDPLLLALIGETYMAMKQYGKATEYLEKAAAIAPQNVGLRTGLGMSRLVKGDTEKAVAELQSAAALDPNEYKADMMLVHAYLGKGEFDRALQAAAALEKKQPKNPMTFNLMGNAYVGKKDFANARRSFEHALALKPTFVTAAISLAQLDVRDKHPEAAKKRFEDVLAADKNNLPAMLALANLAISYGQEKEYVGWLDKAIKVNTSALEPRALLVRYYMRKKEAQKALALAQEAQTANPESQEALDLLGSVQFVTGDKDSALVSYGKLLKLAPSSASAYYKLASVQMATKDVAAAQASLNKALQLDPNYMEALVALAMLDVRAGKQADALKMAQQAQARAPNLPAGFVLEGDVLMAQRRYAEAARAYEKAFAMGKNGALAIKRHQAQAFAGDVNKANAELQQWLKEQPNDLGVRGYLAQVFMNSGKNKQAIEQYQFILQKVPANLLVLNNLALLYHQEKDARALPTAEQAYKLKPGDVTIADTLGWILVEQGKVARGAEVLQKAVVAAPKNPEIAYHYAVALAKSGDKAKARKQLEELLSSGKGFPQKEQAKVLLKQL